MDQLTIDFKIKTLYPNPRKGQLYIVDCVPKMYAGTDSMFDLFDDMSRKFPTLINYQYMNGYMNNPFGYVPPIYKLDPKFAATLVALNVAGQIGKITGLANGFLPPGLDGPVQAIKGVISNFTNQIPGLSAAAGAAADIANNIAKITQINTLVKLSLGGPAGLVFKAITSNFGLPAISISIPGVNLQVEVAKLAAAASNPIAFAAQAALISRTFPMINTNMLIAKMLGVAGTAGRDPCTGLPIGKPFNIKSMVPNLAFAAGAMALKALPGITPTGDALKPQKTANPPKPVKPIEMKNLFAEAAAASSLSTLTQPLSQFMGMMATIAPQTALVKPSPVTTALGTQKLVGTSNTANWGSGGYGRDNSTAELERKRLELTAKIEKHTAELEAMVDYSKLTSMSYPELIKKYPRITPTMSVAEALHIIEETDAKAKAAANTAPKTSNTTSTTTA
jgi:hypothetical protein